MQRHQLGGIFLAIATTVLLSIATFSSPFSKEIYFVRAATSFGEVRFGGFGWCRYIDATTGSAGSKECWGPVFGYHWDPEVTVWLTRAEITIGIAALFSLAALVSIVLEAAFPNSYALSNPVWFRICAVLTSLLSILGFVFSAVLWYNTRVRFDKGGVDAKYGPALWILLGGTISAALSLCVGGPRFTGRHMYRAHNQASYTV